MIDWFLDFSGKLIIVPKEFENPLKNGVMFEDPKTSPTTFLQEPEKSTDDW